MKRFFCAAFFIAVITLLAACGALNTTTAAAQATATPTSSTSRAQKTPSTVKVNETAAKVPSSTTHPIRFAEISIRSSIVTTMIPHAYFCL